MNYTAKDVLVLVESSLSDVKPRVKPPEGLFATGTDEQIADWIINSHSQLKSAVSCLNFYVNRAGSNLSDERKKVFDSVRNKLHVLK